MHVYLKHCFKDSTEILQEVQFINLIRGLLFLFKFIRSPLQLTVQGTAGKLRKTTLTINVYLQMVKTHFLSFPAAPCNQECREIQGNSEKLLQALLYIYKCLKHIFWVSLQFTAARSAGNCRETKQIYFNHYFTFTNVWNTFSEFLCRSLQLTVQGTARKLRKNNFSFFIFRTILHYGIERNMFRKRI